MFTAATAGNSDQRKCQRANWYFCAGLVGFFLCLFASVAIEPAGLWVNHGFSFYGDLPVTKPLYWLGFFLCITCLLLSSLSLPARMPFLVVRMGLQVIALLLVGVVVTTVPNSPAYDQVHHIIGVVLFIMQFLLSGWLALVIHRDRANLTFFLLLLLGGVLSLLGLLNILPYLLEGQTVFLLAFGLVVVYTTGKLSAG